jgi:hypothetical protein
MHQLTELIKIAEHELKEIEAVRYSLNMLDASAGEKAG